MMLLSMSCMSWGIMAAVSIGCGAALPPLPSQGGPSWTEVQSEHFTLWTDAPMARGKQLVQQMEQHHQVITRAMNNAPSTRSFAIALRSARETDVYLPRNTAAIAWPANGPLSPGMLFAADTPANHHAIAHELSHVISHSIVRHQPRWLAEGIATYFQMAELAPGATSVQVGAPRRDLIEYFRDNRPVPATELFGCRQSCETEGFYPTSWAMFSFLVNQHFDRLAHYLLLLNDPQVDFAAAWQEAFPDLSPDAVDLQLHRWIRGGDLRLPRIAVTVRNVPATARPLSDADVLAARSLLRMHATPTALAMQRDLDAALTADRTHPLARLVEAAVTGKIAVPDARAVAAAHPGDWRAWWILHFALRGSPEAATAQARLCALAPRDLGVCHAPGSP